MIAFTCPGCQATFKLPDDLAGKTARCSKCNQRFTVPGGKPAPAPAPVKKVALKPVEEILEAEVIDEPSGPPPLRSKRRAEVDEVEVVDDGAIEEPRRARKSAPARMGRDDRDDDRRRDDRDDDDDDFDRPRRKKKRKKTSGSMGVVMASIGAGSFVLMIIVGIAMAATASHNVVIPNNQNQPFINFNQPNFPQNPVIINAAPIGPAGAITLVNGVYDAQNQLTLADPRDTGPRTRQSRAKRYTVQLEAGKTYTIDMMSVNPQQAFFDPYLRLEQNGISLMEDDDGGDGLNSQIIFTPPQTGSYVIVTTTLIHQLGPYRFSIRANP